MDALRAIAAGAVVLGHSRDLLMRDYRPGSGFLTAVWYAVSGLGHEAVVLFFVLSGYWIARSVDRRAPEGFWSGYLVDRLSRLWVVIIPALALTLVADLVGLAIGAPVYAGATGAHTAQAVSVDASHYLGTLVFLQSLAVPAPGTNGPLWSVALEFWFYIWFASIWMAARHRRFGIALASLGLGIAYPGMWMGFACWLCGAALHFATRGREPVAPIPALAAGLALSGVAVVLKLPDVALASGAALGLYGAMGLRLGWPKALDVVSRYGADASFSLYAIHMPIVVLASTTLVWSERLEPTPAAIAAVLALVGLSAALAWAFAGQTEARTSAIRTLLRARAPA